MNQAKRLKSPDVSIQLSTDDKGRGTWQTRTEIPIIQIGGSKDPKAIRRLNRIVKFGTDEKRNINHMWSPI